MLPQNAAESSRPPRDIRDRRLFPFDPPWRYCRCGCWRLFQVPGRISFLRNDLGGVDILGCGSGVRVYAADGPRSGDSPDPIPSALLPYGATSRPPHLSWADDPDAASCVSTDPYGSSVNPPERVHPRSASIQRAERVESLHNPDCAVMGYSVAASLKGSAVRAIFVIGSSCKSPGRRIFSSRLLYRKPLQIGPFNLFLPYSIAGLGLGVFAARLGSIPRFRIACRANLRPLRWLLREGVAAPFDGLRICLKICHGWGSWTAAVGCFSVRIV